jgi:hypothetical protein
VVGQDQFHDWVIFPLPESNRAVKFIADFLG